MNPIKCLLFLSVFVALAGCGTTTTTGNKFDASKIHDIRKGVTTSAELIKLLGQPLRQSVESADETIWEYAWEKMTSETSSGSDGPVVTTAGDKKTLAVFIRKGVVINYVYKDDPFWNEKLKGSH
jgi:hypothetical protein